MKPAVANPATRVRCLRIVPITGSPIYLTDYPIDLAMGGHTYLSTSGYQFTGYSTTADFSPASIDLDGISGASGISRSTVAGGVFDGARAYFFDTSWASPVEDEEQICVMLLGKAVLLDDRYRISCVSLVDVLNQSIGDTYLAACQKVFCGQEYGGCKASLAANTVTGALTHVTNSIVFRDATRGEPLDAFGAGTIVFTSGANAGLSPIEIKSYAADGTITLYDAFYYLPAVGDTYSMVRGCRKTLAACQSRVGGSNVINFGGYPFIPSGATYAHIGRSGSA